MKILQHLQNNFGNQLFIIIFVIIISCFSATTVNRITVKLSWSLESPNLFLFVYLTLWALTNLFWIQMLCKLSYFCYCKLYWITSVLKHTKHSFLYALCLNKMCPNTSAKCLINHFDSSECLEVLHLWTSFWTNADKFSVILS